MGGGQWPLALAYGVYPLTPQQLPAMPAMPAMPATFVALDA